MSLSENKMLIEEERRRKKSGCEGEATLDLFFFSFVTTFCTN
jgi:hypothetical protein